MCEYPYKEFEKWMGKGSLEISLQEVQERLGKLNGLLKECIEHGSSQKKVEQQRWFQPKLPKGL